MKLINELESSLLILQDKLSSHSSKSTAIQMLLALWMDEKAQFQFMMAGGLQHLVNNLNVIDDKLFLNLVHSITFLAQSSSTSHRFKNSFPRVMMMETKLLNVLVDIVNIHLLEDSKSSQMRVKMSIHILDSILECYNPKDQMMEKYVWRNSDNCLGSLIMNVLVTILNTKNEKCSKIIIRMIYKWIRKDPKAFHLLVNRFDQYLPAFVHIMRNTEEIDLKGAILAILHTVTNDSKSRSLLIKSEYLTEQAVHLLKTTKKQIQQSAVNYLASICVGCPKIPSLILSANVLPILISILRENHTEHYTMDTLILVREVLQKEVVDPNLLNCQAYGIWTILNAVGKNYKSSILQSVALDLFLHLANDVRYLQMISKWQGLESIISKLLSDDDIKRRQAAVVIMSHIYQMTTPNLEVVKNKDNELELRCSDNKKRRNPIEGSEQDEIEQPWKSIKTES